MNLRSGNGTTIPSCTSPQPSWVSWRVGTGLVGLAITLTMWTGSLEAQPMGRPGTLPAPNEPAALAQAQPKGDVKEIRPGIDLKDGAGKVGELPSPKNAGPFAPDKIRMPRLGDGPLGTTPKPTEKEQKELAQFIEGVVDPKLVLDLVEGRTRLILMKETPKQIQIADDTIASFNLLNPRQLTMLGRRTGTTVLTLWFDDPANKDKDKIISYLLRVIPDPEAKERLERALKALEQEVNRLFPDSRITLTIVGDKLAVSGQAKDVAEGTQILRIIRANAPGQTPTIPVSSINVEVRPGDPTNSTGTPGLESFLTAGGPNIINLLRIPGEQQVSLRVTVAEVRRSALRSIGVDFSIVNNAGITVFANTTGNIANRSPNLPIQLDNGQIPIQLQALKAIRLARTLAEPVVVAMNGETANFQSGGSFPVPIIGGFGAVGVGGTGGLQGVQFVPFGVQLSFTPVITDRDRLRLIVNGSVSVRDPSIGTNIGGGNVAGLNQRTFNTTVEMREGQTLAIAGLIQNDLSTERDYIPFFGDIPFIGRLVGGHDRATGDENELVILITPELVHPLNPKEVVKLPGSDYFEPSDWEFYVLNRMESRRSYDYRSQVMNDIHRMMQYRRAEQHYIFGPSGHSYGDDAPASLPPIMQVPLNGAKGNGNGGPNPANNGYPGELGPPRIIPTDGSEPPKGPKEPLGSPKTMVDPRILQR